MGPVILFVDGHRKTGFYRQLILALQQELGADCQPVSAPALVSSELDADLVIVNDETWPFCGAALPDLHRRAIPTLHLIDGIIEWRNVWENPQRDTTAGLTPLFQPVLADKIACLGRSQAQMIESWGNIGRCEITGSPRFDGIARRRVSPASAAGSSRILITTARTPGFTEAQVQLVRASLVDLKDWLRGSGHEVTWRLSAEVADVADGENTMCAESLAEQLQVSDAVVTTPSTVQLEAMLAGVPTALLDYGNYPSYVAAAWTMTAREHIDTVMPLLLSPSPERVLHQDFLLHDNLECRTPATPRVVQLIEQMVDEGRRSRAEDLPLRFSPQMVGSPIRGLTSTSFEGPALHLDATDSDLTALRAEIAHLRRAMRLSLTQKAYRALCQLEIRLRKRGGRG